TGTDTGVGKSVISGLLGRYLSGKGCRVITQKWVQTGSKNFSEDVELHLKLMKRKKRHIEKYLSYVSPYTFKSASSPHLAAALEKKTISADKIKKSFRFLSDEFDFVIIEGVGGALVPFSNKKLVIDIARELDLAVLVVAGNRLGVINHTLLTLEAIKKRNMKTIGIIFNNQPRKTDDVILKNNPRIIKKLTGETILGVLPWMKDKEQLYKKFTPIGKRIIVSLKEKLKNG
ncbi:MAG: dethiobiotin synthase, partial [Candidatus Omnitrophota bacterium]|nr:dethiobiotin synthase [Candidatus Omnitrophota bacterium]